MIDVTPYSYIKMTDIQVHKLNEISMEISVSLNHQINSLEIHKFLTSATNTKPHHNMQSVLAGNLLKKLSGTEGSLYRNLGCLNT